MSRRVRIPFLIDVMRVDDAHVAGLLAKDPRLDRGYTPTGPLFNRMLARHISRAFRIGTVPFPTMRRRHDKERIAIQSKLATMMPDASTLVEDIRPLVAYVRGDGKLGDVGPDVQALIGRRFRADYPASPALWKAALAFDAAARSSNPFRWFLSFICGTIRTNRRKLADAVNGDPTAIHATGIAVHNVMASLDRMRISFADPACKAKLDGMSAATAFLAAPASVLRQVSRVADVPGGTLYPGTLVTFELATAAGRTLDSRVAFQSEAWSACPASAFVLRLLATIWTSARAESELR